MPKFVALLRGINVGGKAMVAMAELKKLFEQAGFPGAQTLLQSGNVIFEAKAAEVGKLETKLEKAAAKKFARPIDFIVCDGPTLNKIIAGNPFPQEAKDDPSHLLVVFLRSTTSAAVQAALKAAITGPEYFQAGDRCLYLVYPDGIGRSKLTNAVIDRKLGITGTARNWNTVRKIAALFDEH
jgi:uncharacterized protein (DUF1697 family)